MISIQEALEAVAARARPVIGDDFMPVESVELAASFGRILREEVRAAEDSPPFHRSIRDGFAVRAEDVAAVPVELEVIGESRAGAPFAGRIGRGQCAEIMTGAAVPAGADAVVMVEDAERLAPTSVRILQPVAPGRSIQPIASEHRAGDLILPPGRRIGTAEVSVLAAAGHVQVAVSRQPRVGILSTGDELVDIGQTPGPAQIRNSNSYSLMAQTVAAGAAPHLLGIARDDRSDLAEKIARGLECDILLTSGGVSMGKYDLVEGVLAEFGVAIHFNRVAMKPGKPTVFGSRGRTFVFGLPGNPVSTVVSFQLFVRGLIRRLLHTGGADPGLLEAQLEHDVRCDPVREACVPAHVHFSGGRYRLVTVDWKGSSDLTGLARANAYVLVPRREGVLASGAAVQFMPEPAFLD